MSKSLLPQNSSALEHAIDVNNAKSLDALMPAVRDIGYFWSAWKCPIDLLPFLAWALSVDVWDANWPENVKRQVVASSVEVHRTKGTRRSIELALTALDFGVSLSEWFEHGGDPYTFRLDVFVSTRGISASEIDMIRTVIRNTKNARSWLERLRVYLTAEVTAFQGVFTQRGRVSTINPYVPPPVEITVATVKACVTMRHRTSIIEAGI